MHHPANCFCFEYNCFAYVLIGLHTTVLFYTIITHQCNKDCSKQSSHEFFVRCVKYVHIVFYYFLQMCRRRCKKFHAPVATHEHLSSLYQLFRPTKILTRLPFTYFCHKKSANYPSKWVSVSVNNTFSQPWKRRPGHPQKHLSSFLFTK
jgi:hypothetical protein